MDSFSSLQIVIYHVIPSLLPESTSSRTFYPYSEWTINTRIHSPENFLLEYFLLRNIIIRKLFTRKNKIFYPNRQLAQKFVYDCELEINVSSATSASSLFNCIIGCWINQPASALSRDHSRCWGQNSMMKMLLLVLDFSRKLSI